MNVTASIGILSRVRSHILGLANTRIVSLVASDWAARAVLRYRRLKSRTIRLIAAARSMVIPRSWRTVRVRALELLGHAFVLSLGFALVVPAVTGRFASRPVEAEYSGYVLWTSQVPSRSAPELTEILKAPTVEEPPAPPITEQLDPTLAPAPAPVRLRPKPATFTPPPGSGGSGLAAIYAVFGNSPGLSWALRVANCESHYNPLAVNPYSGASGLFQFMPSTWNANFPGQNIWDPMVQARAALVFYNAGRQSAWTCK